MNLPSSNDIKIAPLASSFASTSATYKFYWFLAILELTEEGHYTIPKIKLFARMIANSWYTVNYFNVSFGKQDLIQSAVKEILKSENLTIDLKKNEIVHAIENSTNFQTTKTLFHFNKNVPHWFLSPWIVRSKSENDVSYKKRIYEGSKEFDNDALYALYDDHIIVNPVWIDYLKDNSGILKDFTYWNLSLFLIARNPSVPDIPNKLIKPPFRGTLANQRKNYWDIVFRELGQIECIFTKRKLTVDRYALDHFVPHAFVAHNLIWNLLPIDTIFNSSKGDKLPSIVNDLINFSIFRSKLLK